MNVNGDDDSWLEADEDPTGDDGDGDGDDSGARLLGKAVSKLELHKLTAISPVTLDKYFREGAPVISKGSRREGWRIDTARFVKWLRNRDVRLATGNPEGAAYDMAKGRDKHAQAQLREFELAERARVTVTRRQAVALYSQHVGEYRKRLLEIESQVPHLSAEQRKALNDSIDLALAEFSGMPALGEEYDFG